MNRLEKIIKIFKKFKTHGATADANDHIKSVKELAKYLGEISNKNFEDTERNLHGLIFAINSYAFRLNCRKEDIKEFGSGLNLESKEIENEIQDCEKKISECEKKFKGVKPEYKEVAEKCKKVEKELKKIKPKYNKMPKRFKKIKYKEFKQKYKNEKNYEEYRELKEKYEKLEEEYGALKKESMNYREYKSYVEKLDDLQEIEENFNHVPQAIAAIKDFIEGYEKRMKVDDLKKIMKEYEEAKSKGDHTPNMLSNILSTINKSIENTESWFQSKQEKVNKIVSGVKKDVNEAVKLEKELRAC